MSENADRFAPARPCSPTCDPEAIDSGSVRPRLSIELAIAGDSQELQLPPSEELQATMGEAEHAAREFIAQLVDVRSELLDLLTVDELSVE